MPSSASRPRPDAEPGLLGDFLRARRERLRPEDFGLPRGTRRRAPGLRREEVAALCGVSPTWITWIEQGRAASVSLQTLAALAAGLKLSAAERAYLFGIAPQRGPARLRTAEGAEPAADTQQLSALVAAVRTPAYVLDRHWDAVVWNKPAGELFADWLGKRRPADRNLLRYVFAHPQARRLIVDWDERAPRLVAEYRADTAAWHDDPVRQALVEALCFASADFAAAWRSQQVLAREGGLRVFRHPRRGLCRYRQFTLRVAGRAELKLSVLVPEDG